MGRKSFADINRLVDIVREANSPDPPKRMDVPHYTAGGLEVIDILRAKMTPEMFEGFLLGNVIKYACRYRLKGTPVTDLHKAQTYLGWLQEITGVKK